MAFKCFQRFGPDEVFFRVTGVPDPQTLTRVTAEENFDIMINFDVQNTDLRRSRQRLQQFVALNQLELNNRLNVDACLMSLLQALIQLWLMQSYSQ